MKLRGRFTLTLVLAALVPISVAAITTTRVVSTTLREDYEKTRTSTEEFLHYEIGLRQKQIRDSVVSLASHENSFAGGLLLDLVKGNGKLDGDVQRRLREQGGLIMRGLSLDALTVTGPDDTVLVAPHYRATLSSPMPAVRQVALATGGNAYFAQEKLMNGSAVESVLVCEAALQSRDSGYSVAVRAGRRFGEDLLASVRRADIDARIVLPRGEVLLPPAGRNWDELAKHPPIRAPLNGPDGKPVAIIEVAVSDRGLDQLLFDITLASAALAVGALGAVIVLGLFVARRTARDLDRLVEGSLAAARGDLDHRVTVRRQDEVGAVASAFNFMMEDLRTAKDKLVIAERIAAWQDIARRLAHEIKNPLTPIQMAMDTLRKSYKKQHPDFAEILEESTTTVLQEADRLKKIVAEFSDFARMPKPEFVRIDLNDVVRSAIALYQDAAPVTANLGRDVPPLDADKAQINQIVLNLVENARDAIDGRSGGKITVATRRGEANDRAVLVVEDNGPGVPSGLKDKVFAPYFTTKNTKGGTGLGLAIVHRIVSDHGGRITLSDTPGGGARFTIELPLRNGTALLASRI